MAANEDTTFPAVDVERELNPGANTHLEVDPISSKISSSINEKEKGEKAEKLSEKCQAMQSLKKTVIISAFVVAAAGAAFAIAKKMREK